MKQEKKENLFDGFDSFRTLFGHTLYVEHTFLEYDCIPILCACVDEAGNKWFCNCTEFRYCERWTIYPTTEERIQAVIRKELTYKEAFGVYVLSKLVATRKGRHLFCMRVKRWLMNASCGIISTY